MKKIETNYHWNSTSLFLKRGFDIITSTLAIVFLFPIFILLIITVGLSNGFPVFYKQKRVGRNKIPFEIYKIRTMHIDAEQNGPQLSNEYDNRITNFGKTLRKWRLDELPQFYNVLKGDMSIVGPRPERQYFVEQLEDLVPEYEIIFNVRPGLTSSGMINFGYASNIEEMSERAPHDIAYVKNLSLGEDFNIILKTINVLIEGSGK